jgi:hypothetical protein
MRGGLDRTSRRPREASRGAARGEDPRTGRGGPILRRSLRLPGKAGAALRQKRGGPARVATRRTLSRTDLPGAGWLGVVPSRVCRAAPEGGQPTNGPPGDVPGRAPPTHPPASPARPAPVCVDDGIAAGRSPSRGAVDRGELVGVRLGRIGAVSPLALGPGPTGEVPLGPTGGGARRPGPTRRPTVERPTTACPSLPRMARSSVGPLEPVPIGTRDRREYAARSGPPPPRGGRPPDPRPAARAAWAQVPAGPANQRMTTPGPNGVRNILLSLYNSGRMLIPWSVSQPPAPRLRPGAGAPAGAKQGRERACRPPGRATERAFRGVPRCCQPRGVPLP